MIKKKKKEDWDTWAQKYIGIEPYNFATYGSAAFWGKDTVRAVIGGKNGKLCIGIFKTYSYTPPEFIWSSTENFNFTREFDLGYGEKTTENIYNDGYALEIIDENNFFGRLGFRSSIKEVICAIFVKDGKCQIKEYATDGGASFWNIKRWYKRSLIINNILYTLFGEMLPVFIETELEPVNIYEGIFIAYNEAKRINITTNEIIWSSKFNEDINASGSNPPKIAIHQVKQEDDVWVYNMEIVYYNGNKEQRTIKLNVNTGEICK